MAEKTVVDNYYDLSGGMNAQLSPLFIKDNQCEVILNYDADAKIGALTKRPGISYLIGQVVNDVDILGMYFFNDIQGTDYSNVLVACDDAASPTNSDIKKISSNAWANSLADDTAGATPEFASFIDNVFRVNGEDKVKVSSDLSTWTDNPNDSDTTVPDLTPKYVCVWEDRVYIANENGTTKYPSRIYWSSLPSGSPLDITWSPSSNYADINPDDNDEITWITPFGNRMLIFKEEGLYRWTFGRVEPDKIIDVGTPAGRTVKHVGGICFFANKYGVWMYKSGTRPELISRKVQPFIDAISASNLSNMVAEVDRDNYYLYIGSVTVDGITYSNTMLKYNLPLDAWVVRTYPFDIKAMARFKRKTLGSTEIYDKIYLGDDDGYIYRMETGNVDYLGTTTKPINGKIVSKEYPLNFPKTSQLRNFFFLSGYGTGAKVSYIKDRDENKTKTWKDLQKRLTSGSVSGRANTVQFHITDNSTTQSRIEGFSIEHLPEGQPRRESEDRRQQN